MEIIYRGQTNLRSRGYVFSTDSKEPYMVEDADGRYLLKTFPKVFDEVKQTPKKAPIKKTTGKDKKED